MTDPLDRLRALCLALPGVTEKEAWGAPTFRVRDRIFAMARAGGALEVWCKAAPGAQEHLVAADPGTFFVPPYVGHKGWVGMRLPGDEADWPAAAELVRRAHEIVADGRSARERRRRG